MKILITGGSGLLGKNLIKILENNHTIYCPSSVEYDVRDYDICLQYTKNINPDMIIHCAAIAKFVEAEKRPFDTIDINIVGSCNIAKICLQTNIRMVYISTSHVFDGRDGNYKSTDKVNPLTKYSKSKVAGEMAAMMCENHLIIRTEFCEETFPFDTAYVDKFSSKEYIDVIVPTIANKCVSSQIGICHVGGPRRSFYEFGKLRNPDVKMGSIKELLNTTTIPILIDTSLISD